MISKSDKPVLPGGMDARFEERSHSASAYSVPDDELERRIAHVLVWNALVPPNTIGVRADGGRITLTGHVELEYQRSAAEAAVRPLCGVFAVTNNITVGRNSFGSR